MSLSPYKNVCFGASMEEGEMGELLFWIVLLGLPALLIGGFAYAHYLKRTGGTSSGEDGA